MQEALTNVLRHSEAKRTSVELVQADSQIILTVRDDGKGVGEEIVRLQPGSVGVGISGMKQRVKEFGGNIQLKNTGKGSLVEVVIPTGARTFRTPVTP